MPSESCFYLGKIASVLTIIFLGIVLFWVLKGGSIQVAAIERISTEYISPSYIHMIYLLSIMWRCKSSLYHIAISMKDY